MDDYLFEILQYRSTYFIKNKEKWVNSKACDQDSDLDNVIVKIGVISFEKECQG